MKVAKIYLSLVTVLTAFNTYAQTTAPQTADELTKQTALLQAQQAYYDQVLQTAKSQQAAAQATVSVQTASLAANTQLQTAKFNDDLALATAIKGSGLSAATGKDGSITFTAVDKTMLPLQRESLVAIEDICKWVGDQVSAKLKDKNGQITSKVFIAPANYETLVQKSVVDIVQLTQLHSAATSGISDFTTAQMQVAATALSGALVSAQYLAGGIQAITKLFRTDYSFSFTTANRQGLFEQVLGMNCKDVLESNVEGKLRLNAAKVLYAWLPEMARFSQTYDSWTERISQRKAELSAERTQVAALKPADKDKKAHEATLEEIDKSTKALSDQEAVLAKYKAVAAAIKTYLGSIGTGTIYDSLVWGQQYLHQFGGLPADIPNLHLEDMYRLSYTLNVQDINIKLSSTFSSDKVRYFATVEVSYSLVSKDGNPVSVGAKSMSTQPKDLKVKQIKGDDYSKVY